MQKLKNKINNLLKKDFVKSLLLYSFIFVIITLFLLSIFGKYDKGLIWAEPDGVKQHIINLRYLRSLIVEFIRTGYLSTLTWNIGNGFDLFSNFAYYISGDIFSYISVLFPTSAVENVYSLLVLLRLYFVGIAFLCFCRFKKMPFLPSTIGSLMYTFCTFTIIMGVRHPYFLNAMILFPLIMIGIEKIIKENKPLFYTAIIAITYMVNFYFAFMISVVIGVYGIVLAIYTYKKDGYKKIIKVLLKTLLYSLLGIMISAIIVFPTIISFLNSERTSEGIVYPYSLVYYRNFMSNIIDITSNGYASDYGVQSLILISLPIFFRKRKENYPLFITLLILFVPLLISQIGSIFCGFGYPNNRWIYAISFIFSFITVIFLKDYKLDKKDLIYITTAVILYLGINAIFDVSIKLYLEIQFIFLLLYILIIYYKDKLNSINKKYSLSNIILLFVFTLGIITTVKYRFDVEGDFYTTEYLNQNGLNAKLNTSYNIPDFNKAINYINESDNDFYKISKSPYDYENVSLIKKFNSIGHYYSITPNIYNELNTDLNNPQHYISFGNKEFDYRTKITTLLGVKYLINNDNNAVPYGYSLINDYKSSSKIYKNDYYLPFGTLYTNYITEEEYEKLTPLQKEDSLLKSTVLNKENISSSLTHNYNVKKFKEINYELIDENGIIDKNNIEIKDINNNTFKLKLDEIINSEVYISFENINFKPYTKEEMINLNVTEETSLTDIANLKKEYKWYQPSYGYRVNVKYNNVLKDREIKDYYTSAYYFPCPDILINLGYYDNTKDEVEVSLSQIGKYTFDNIKIYAVPMDDYPNDIQNLKRSNFNVTEYKNGYLKGTTNATEDGILQLNTMYSKGWKVYVDGKEVETFTSNKYFLGINISKGKHEIYLKYHTPYLKEGLIISIGGIIIFIFIAYKKRKSNN